MFNFPSLQQDTTAAPPGSTRKVTVKTLFDHGHTNRNRLVIYDDDPRIEVVMKAALDRHQDSLKVHEDFLKKTHVRMQVLNDT